MKLFLIRFAYIAPPYSLLATVDVIMMDAAEDTVADMVGDTAEDIVVDTTVNTVMVCDIMEDMVGDSAVAYNCITMNGINYSYI